MDKIIPKVALPEGQSGPWRVERFVITEEGAKKFNLRCMFQPGGGSRVVKPGTYTRLIKQKTLDPMMSDTRAERRDHLWAVQKAKGKVLVTGLGLGVVINAMLLKPEVETVTVIEIDQDIINLVAGHYLNKFSGRLTIIHADAFTWTPPQPRCRNMFDYAWHDIWPSVCSSNWDEMKRLKRHYQNWVTRQDCWCEELVKYYNRIEY